MKRNIMNDQSGLYCITILMKMFGVPVEAKQMTHLFSTGGNSTPSLHLSRTLNELGCKSTVVTKELTDIQPALFPLIGELEDGGFEIFAKYDQVGRKVLVQEMSSQRATWVTFEELQEKISGTFILVRRPDQAQSSSTEFGLKWFFNAALKYRSILFDCILASMFVQVFALLSPLVFMIVIDKVLGNNSLSTLDVLVFALVVVSAFEIILNALRTYLLSHTANRIDLMLGIRLFKHLMALPLSYFESRQVGDTIARVKELETVRHFITGAGLMLFIDLFFLVLFIVVMFLFSPFLSFLVLIALPFLFGASFVITPFLKNKLEDRYSSNASNQSFLVETISGIETIKSNAAEPRSQQRWEEKLTHHVKNGFKGGHFANLIQQSTATISKTLSILLLWFGAREVLAGNLTVGQLIAFNMLSSRVIAPIIRLSQIWKEFQQVKISVSRIADIFNCPSEPGFRPGRVSLPSIKGAIQFEKVSFRHQPEGVDVLQNISFNVHPGEVVGVVGSTGSGKTTLAKLLQRLYIPERGRILVDGVDLSMADSSWFRRQIGVVVQDGVLFNTSIRDNITLNIPDLDIKSVMEAAELAGAHEFIMQLPNGYDTPVGERGIKLSTGQRQRLAIARALAGNPRMLIFDEATSSLDYESELLIQKNMKQICQGRTAVIIAHRLSTIRHADRIITLDKGQLVENDRPEILLRAGGRYAAFHNIQEGRYA
ncbi:type I secretion system permease/ATPase [Desulfopila sp. IMCC35008]|uniref:type I secretion system permease/ATPase n=1 Tax=Desulfopila sp. IMCC35008 TaxID=2653858 RepID=UPI0013D28F15|nr:type I secretion system permease/ATPase [Desulfopila sp. IMCC35008]